VEARLFTENPRKVILGNSEGYKGRKGPGCREPRRKGKLGFASQGGVPCPAYSTVTMTLNNKAVKGCGWLPFVVTEMQRRDVSGYSVSSIPSFSETGLPLMSLLGNS
jgi:hypothetical protein